MCGRLEHSTILRHVMSWWTRVRYKKNASFSHTQNPSLMSFSDESKWLCDFFPSPHLLSLLSIIAYTHRYYCVVDGHHHRGERQTENDYGILSMLTSLLDWTVTILFVNWELKLTCVAFYRRFCTWQQFGIFRKTFYILHCYVETN